MNWWGFVGGILLGLAEVVGSIIAFCLACFAVPVVLAVGLIAVGFIVYAIFIGVILLVGIVMNGLVRLGIMAGRQFPASKRPQRLAYKQTRRQIDTALGIAKMLMDKAAKQTADLEISEQDLGHWKDWQ